MNNIKIIFIGLEATMMVCLATVLFFVDWAKAVEDGSSFLFQIIVILSAINAVLFQHEQQSIEWEIGEESY